MANQRSRRKKAGERRRDEARGPGGPRYGGTSWKRADERAPDERFGRTRSDRAGDLLGIGAGDPAEREPREASFAAPWTAGYVSGGEVIGIRRAVATDEKHPRRRAPSRRRR
ncbi:MAG: hypothetical protein KF773_18745 [Deltaproteobacteria bacterium]|nr:hypothetical protein [Deltaproteobacteria bacterium]MCW5803080.1 hypothetical protein [Deltaproteobacteria bacterium]